jgi:adenylate kinase
MNEPHRLSAVLFIGRPGSGKGTQAIRLAKHLGWTMFSSGGHFKQLIDRGDEFGERIAADYKRGQLSPDWLAEYFFNEAVLGTSPESGVVSEGFPRSLPQAEFAHEVFTWLGRGYKAIYLAVSEEEAMTRQLGRAKVEDRPDSDGEDKIRARFDVYTKSTEPLLEFFRKEGTLIELDGEQTPDKIAEDVRAALNLPAQAGLA